MKVQRLVVAILFVFGVALANGPDSLAQRGRGKGGGKSMRNAFQGDAFSGGGFRNGKGNGGQSAKGASSSGWTQKRSDKGLESFGNAGRDRFEQSRSAFDGNWVDQGLRSDTTVNRRLLNEQRKLEHRQQVAEHLRRVGDMNGNPQLAEVADRLDLKAEEHYQRQLEKLGPDQPLPAGNALEPGVGDGWVDRSPPLERSVLEPPLSEGSTPGERPAANPSETSAFGGDRMDDASLPSVSENASANTRRSVLDQRRPTPGPAKAYQQRLLAEEQKLNQRLSVAEQLRDLGNRQGNSQLLEASSQMEEMALQQYTDQLSKLTEFGSGVSKQN